MNQGDRHLNAYTAAHLLMRVCQKLGFKITFVQYGSTVRTIKKLDEYRKIRRDGNNDATALRHVIKLIDPEEDNILFHLTDGGLCENIERALEELKRMRVTTVGIGIGEEAQEVEEHFPNHIYVPDISGLNVAMVNLMKRLIHR